MIKLPIRVGSDLSERVEASYAEAIQRVGKEEIAYVRSKLPRVLAGLRQGSQDWQSEVASTAGAVFQVYEDANSMSTVSDGTKAALLAALFYLCNPYDIIPDRVRGTGFVDDAVVMNSCLRRVEEEAPDLIARSRQPLEICGIELGEEAIDDSARVDLLDDGRIRILQDESDNPSVAQPEMELIVEIQFEDSKCVLDFQLDGLGLDAVGVCDGDQQHRPDRMM